MSSQFSKKEITEMTKRLSGLKDSINSRLQEIKDNRNYAGDIMATIDEAEANLLLANRVKTAAIDLDLTSSQVLMAANELLNRSEAAVRLGMADTLIKERGFPKVTEALRESVILTDQDLSNLRKLISEIKPLNSAVNAYLWCLKEDETTWRELTSVKYKKSLL